MTSSSSPDRSLRHAHGRVVARLLRAFGHDRLPVIEDAVGQALLEGTLAWRDQGPPDHLVAWLTRAARHRVIDELRRQQRRPQVSLQDADPGAVEVADDDAPLDGVTLAGEVDDDVLRALFACAAPSIPLPSQLVFALRTLCGFSTREIAARLWTSEQNVQKRFERARTQLQGEDLQIELVSSSWAPRAEAVLRMVYVLFTEGYFASSGEQVLRLELCEEALRLATSIARHPQTTSSTALALLALLTLHHARRDARVDDDGLPVLIEDQDRRRFDARALAAGLALLDEAAADGLPSRYHLEACIAAEHALAPSFDATRWEVIDALYARLDVVDPSPLHRLHGAIAHAYAHGPEAGLARLAAVKPPGWLEGSSLWLASAAEMHRRAGNTTRAIELYDAAISLAPAVEARVLQRRRAALRPPP